ncbi:hypothetical protein GCM10010994_33140 [Chelatococcus reniformis]|uniref:Uncharacterized protein n=1 Tax=Chelatococcus reniformis TaxID=1494448 RepID=A0A916XI35_9HYPH|nr:hypothetical protein GCM10010994_33140 [Chelatococcus reniformis]
MIGNRGADAGALHAVAEFGEPGRIVAEAEQNIQMRAASRMRCITVRGLRVAGTGENDTHAHNRGQTSG